MKRLPFRREECTADAANHWRLTGLIRRLVQRTSSTGRHPLPKANRIPAATWIQHSGRCIDEIVVE